MDMIKLDTGTASLRRFALTMSFAFSLAALILWRKQVQWFWLCALVSAVFLFMGAVAPNSLRYVYLAWMRFSMLLGGITSRVMLFILFFLVVTPLGIIVRLSRKDPLELKLDKEKNTYWHQKENKAFDRLDYERRF